MKLFSDASDLIGVEKTDDIQYMKILRLSMWLIGSWPRGLSRSRLHRYYMVTLNICCLIPGIFYIRNNIGKLSYFEMGHTYITVCMNTVALTRGMLMLTEKYSKLSNDFLDIMHLFNYRNNSDYAFKTHILVHKICHFYTIYILGMMMNGILLFNLTPLYNNISEGMFNSERHTNSTFDHSVYYALPIDYTTKLRGYIVVASFNWYISCTCSSYFCVVDLFLSIMVFHLWGHMRLLMYNLENFPLPKSTVAESNGIKNTGEHNGYTEEESKDVFSKLREYIHHHSFIVQYAARMSETYGEVILVYYLFNQVTGCLLLLECSQLDTTALLRYGLLTAINFQQLIQVSVIFELLGSSNDKLANAVYTMPWEHMNTNHRKLVYLMLKQSHQPMNLKAMNIIIVGVQTMIAILKSSFSYFIMLRTVAVDEE